MKYNYTKKIDKKKSNAKNEIYILIIKRWTKISYKKGGKLKISHLD